MSNYVLNMALVQYLVHSNGKINVAIFQNYGSRMRAFNKVIEYLATQFLGDYDIKIREEGCWEIQNLRNKAIVKFSINGEL